MGTLKYQILCNYNVIMFLILQLKKKKKEHLGQGLTSLQTSEDEEQTNKTKQVSSLFSRLI